VASDSTAFRMVDRIASEPGLLEALRVAHARARARFNTGVRELASISGTRGDARCWRCSTGRARRDKPSDVPVSGADVRRVLSALLPAPKLTELPEPAEPEPCELDEEETIAVDAVPDALRELTHEIDELLKVRWEGKMDVDQRDDVMHEVKALRARLDRLTRRIRDIGPNRQLCG
jgi:hypothetical protein